MAILASSLRRIFSTNEQTAPLQQDQSSFFKIPLEIRQEIYRELVTRPATTRHIVLSESYNGSLISCPCVSDASSQHDGELWDHQAWGTHHKRCAASIEWPAVYLHESGQSLRRRIPPGQVRGFALPILLSCRLMYASLKPVSGLVS